MSEYDQREVPILGELEDEFRRMVGEAFAPAPAPAPARPAPRAPWVRTGRRILGRAAVAGALAGVVGATALATKSVVQHDPVTTKPVVLQRVDGRELVLRHYHGKLCLDVSFPAGVASRCMATPPTGGVAPLSAPTPAGRVVVGIAGAGVDEIRVQSGERTVDVTTQPVGRGPSRDVRWFAALLPAPPPGRPPAAALLTPRRASGARAGHAVADCTLGTVASCRAARARAAREHR